MKIVIAMDSFKGCLTSLEAGEAAAEGVRNMPNATVIVRPLADGGEGTVAALTEGVRCNAAGSVKCDAAGSGETDNADGDGTDNADGGEEASASAAGRIERVTVTGPLGKPVECEYGIVRKSSVPGGARGGTASDDFLAVIESSGACGLPLVPADRRNPMNTTTYGLGEVILNAMSKGCRRFLIGLGGSATNDGGAGMLQALGYRLTDGNGQPIGYGAAGLMKLAAIEPPEEPAAGGQPARSRFPEILGQCTIRVACDVTNPLCGPLGSSAVYGPQKGARAEDIPAMDEALRRYAVKVRALRPEADPEEPGSGAAGGLGYAFRAVLGAELLPGSQLVIEETKLEEYITGADLVITGEGRLDAQTAMGKAPAAVAALARSHGIPVIALAGSVEADASTLRKMGLTAWYGINDRAGTDPATAIRPEVARRNMAETAEYAVREHEDLQ